MRYPILRFTLAGLVCAAPIVAAGATEPTPVTTRRASAEVAFVQAPRVTHHTATVDGRTMAYREAGPADAPVIVLLHGFPSSSRMFDRLMPLLAHRYRVIAPDYPGFGHSDPLPQGQYTFDAIAGSVGSLIAQLHIERYALLMSDYGGPVGMRLAMAQPQRISALIVQNAVAHEEGLSPVWDKRKAFWKDRATHQAAAIKGLSSLQATRARHLGTTPHPERYDPDLWTDEFAFLSAPGNAQRQVELFYDYRTNLAAYPDWQAWLRKHKPPILVAWGKYDPNFTQAGAWAYQRDVPEAEVHILEAGHFPLDEALDQSAALVLDFLARQKQL